ncbi:MAG: formate dehydrogenase [Campylobacter sp.]|jgi:uncharacterized alpha-E superfamily protein|nr:MAG: formate dehydrogenase [Campylobacter sp.]
MNTSINYEKYETMSKRSIFNQLLKAEAKLSSLEQDFKEKISAQRELVKFLRAKTKSKIDEKNISIPALDEAIREFKNGEVDRFKNFDEYEKAMNSDV